MNDAAERPGPLDDEPGASDQVLTANPRGTRYVVVGRATDEQTPVGVVVRFVKYDQLLIITVYEIA